ncbi:MAG: hypothetical protein AAF871_13705 [Pseudomonadota bacterium]
MAGADRALVFRAAGFRGSGAGFGAAAGLGAAIFKGLDASAMSINEVAVSNWRTATSVQ